MGINTIQYNDFAICTVKYQMSHHSKSYNLKEYMYNFFFLCFTSVNKYCAAAPLKILSVFHLLTISAWKHTDLKHSFIQEISVRWKQLLLKTWQELVVLDTELLTMGEILIH